LLESSRKSWKRSKESIMHNVLKASACAALLAAALLAAPNTAEAGKVEGVGIGAGAGALIAGPVGAVVGGVIGYKVGGPNIISGNRRCWRNDRGRRVCRR
jgi:osmotically inducible lipoprotein OsmB